MTKNATTASRFPASRLLILDARVEIDGQVDEHEGERDDEHATLHDGKVAGEDALNHEQPHARPREDGLGEDGAAEEIARLHPDQRDDGNERVLEAVAEDHAAFDEPL